MKFRSVYRICQTVTPKHQYFRLFGNNAINTGALQGPVKCVFSGIQPTGIPHVGNYFGAICHWISLQDLYDEVIFSIVDLHSITVPQEPNQLRDNILNMAASLLACGVNTERSILFQQSAVAPHAELAWILGCLTSMPRLEHLPQWKQKSENQKEVPFGLFSYPVLQAADILLYKATHVPVGDDQVKHVELARHLAKLFNRKFGNFFPLPKPITGDLKRIRSLRTPANKMSKSEVDAKGRIELTDTPEEIIEKCRKAVSDSNPKITYEPDGRPGISNLVDIHAAIRNCTPDDIVKENQDIDTLQYKSVLADCIIQKLSPIREEILRLKAEPGHIHKVLHEGNVRARDIAETNFNQIKQLIGLL